MKEKVIVKLNGLSFPWTGCWRTEDPFLSPPPGAPPQQSRNPTGLEKVGVFSISLLLGHFNNSDPISGPFMEKALSSTFGVSAASH